MLSHISSIEKALSIERGFHIYVLQLCDKTNSAIKKYYVGKTTNVDNRVKVHTQETIVSDDRKTHWTQKYKVEKVLYDIPNNSTYDEDGWTLVMMHIYGFDNVRGGSISQEVPTVDEIKVVRNTLLKPFPRPDNLYNVYLLRLEGNHYFIANLPSYYRPGLNGVKEFTDNHETLTSSGEDEWKHQYRIDGSKWLKCHPFIDTLGAKTDCTLLEVDTLVVAAMCKFGLEVVRGGHFSAPILSESQHKFLNKAMLTAQDRCYRCKKSGHFAKACPYKHHFHADY